MKRVALILFFLALLSILYPSNCDAALKLFVGENEVALKHPLVMINGNFMIPADVFEAYFDAQVNIDASSGNIELVFPGQTILMQLGVESALVDGRQYKLDVPPQLVEGEYVVPVRFVANRLGLSLVFDQDIMGLRLETPGEKKSPVRSFTSSLIREPNEAIGQEQGEEPDAEEAPREPIVLHHPDEEQDLQEIIFMGGPRSRVFLNLQSYTGYQTYLLQEPDRLVVDLFGVGGDALPMVETQDHPVVRSIRSSRFDEDTMRIVFDLNGSTGYRVHPWPEGGLEVEFNFQLTALELQEDEDQLELRFRASAAPIIEAVHLEDPLRLVLDLQDTTLMIPSFDKPMGQGRVVRLRASQHTPSVTRIVLQVTEPVSPLPVEQLEDGVFALPLFLGTVREANDYLASRHGGPTSLPEEEEVLPSGDLSGLTIAVDPGHGGSDPGAIGYHGTFEKDVNLAIGLYLGELLSQAGARVVYTRENDTYVSIFERPAIANQASADLYISVHANAHVNRGTVRGTETLYRAKDPASESLARAVQDELVKAITLVNRRIWGREDLAVFNQTKMPAIMVEVGFIDNADEELLLRAAGFQKVAAQGIYNGIRRFYLENKR
ncbi:MAG: AMIN domain-containing protein [Firmicutes bacterium]|nr:AMIN domain-containing protein [Bacillota bacterium]